MGHGPQKPEHGGNFYIMPRRVQESVAWRCASLRARVVLSVFLARHTGFNNGHLAISISELCEAVGDQNRGANSKAVVELIELGFLECTCDADRRQSKAREYRVTFIATGEGKNVRPATNEYADWRPAERKLRQFGGARTAPPEAISGAVTAPTRKLPVAVTAPCSTVTRGFEAHGHGAVTAPLLVNQSAPPSGHPSKSVISPPKLPRANSSIDARVDVQELREWTQATIRTLGYGGARKLALDSDVPEPIISRFRSGRGLPDHHRLRLQLACGRALPYIRWRSAAA